MMNHFPKSLVVTDQEIDLTTLSERQKFFTQELLTEIQAKYTTLNHPRMIIGIAGPSGSGKSVLVALLKYLSQLEQEAHTVETVGIDAYSYPNSLLSHTPVGTHTLKEVKGRYDTYNTTQLVNDLAHFRQGDTLMIPEYSRKIHDPVPSAKQIQDPNTLLLVEGLWILSDFPGWESVRNTFDFSYFLNGDQTSLRTKTIARHEAGGRSPKDAEQYYETVDAVNYDLVCNSATKAHKLLPAFSLP